MGLFSDRCPGCGERVKKGAKFCSKCDASAKGVEESNQPVLSDDLNLKAKEKIKKFEERLDRIADKQRAKDNEVNRGG